MFIYGEKIKIQPRTASFSLQLAHDQKRAKMTLFAGRSERNGKSIVYGNDDEDIAAHETALLG